MADSLNPMVRSCFHNVWLNIWEVFVRNSTFKLLCWDSNFWHAAMAPSMASVPTWRVPDMSISAALIIGLIAFSIYTSVIIQKGDGAALNATLIYFLDEVLLIFVSIHISLWIFNRTSSRFPFSAAAVDPHCHNYSHYHSYVPHSHT